MNRRYVLAGVLLLVIVTGNAGTITTPGITVHTATAAVSCMRWMPIGLCFWLECSWTGCSVETTVKVGHFNPDLVVSSYNEIGGNPWLEIRATLGLAQKAAATGLLGALLPVPVDSAGNRTEGNTAREHKNLLFRETDAIGHPVASLSQLGNMVGLLCQSQTTPFLPYFQSGIDALSWRQEVPEIFYPASLVPGFREMGTWPLQTWGSVYPRTGWTTQTDEAKAAAITAQRAGDIVTRPAQPHVYVPLSSASYLFNDVTTIIDNWTGGIVDFLVNQWFPVFSGEKVWPPGPLVEGNRRTGTWQMLAPVPEATCGVFGESDLAGISSWGGGRIDSGGDYAWTLWRPYKCCRRGGQFFLFDIDWMNYPP